MSHRDSHVIYVQQDTSESVKIYFDYLESDDKGLFIIETILIMLLVELLFIEIVNRKRRAEKRTENA